MKDMYWKRYKSLSLWLTLWLWLSLTLSLTLSGCANRGVGPQGGPVDSIPPVVVKEDPVNGTLNYHEKDRKIEITFDEYVQLNNVSKNLLISPPQLVLPDVKVFGKKVSVTFAEPLLDSTTYTLEFGQAICDYHEQVPLQSYTYSFSTGDWIDSLCIAGYVVNSADLNPISGVIVGVHRDSSDAMFTKFPFMRIARTDSTGWFCVNNLAPGRYRLFALNDMSADYCYQPGEGLAFMESMIAAYQPSDSVVEVPTLWYFNENKRRTYFQRWKREKAHRVQLLFSASMTETPRWRSLRPSEVDSTRSDSAWVDWLDYTWVQKNERQDTITLWLTDSAAIRQDSLWLELSYLKSDSMGQLQPQMDTLTIVYRAPRLSAKAKAKVERTAKNRKLAIQSNAKNAFDIYLPLQLAMETPIDSMWIDKISLWQRVDTALQPLPLKLAATDSSRMSYAIEHVWEPKASYELHVDSAAFRDMYGVVNDSMGWKWTIKSLEEYATLRIRLKHFVPQARVQILNDKDQVLRDEPATPEGTLFKYLAPKACYVRMYIDKDNNGEWTTGDWGSKRQPEPVYYFPSKLTLRANWDFEEEFDHLALPQLDSKPQTLVKDAATATKK